MLWRAAEASSYFGSPLVFRDKVYMVNKVGVAFCLDAGTGEGIWHERLKGECWVSPICAGNRAYFFTVDGIAHVIAADNRFQILAENVLDEEGHVYGVAVSDHSFFLRYGRSLLRIGQPHVQP